MEMESPIQADDTDKPTTTVQFITETNQPPPQDELAG